MKSQERNRFTIRIVSSDDGPSLSSLLNSQDEFLLNLLSTAIQSIRDQQHPYVYLSNPPTANQGGDA